MNSRERVNAALSHIEPDRTPIFEYVLLSPVADALLGRKYVDFGGDPDIWMALACEQGYERTLRQYAADRVDLAEILGHDLIYCVPNPTAEQVEHSKLQKVSATEPTGYDSDPVNAIRRRNADNQIIVRKPANDQQYMVYQYIKDELRNRGLDLPIYAPAFTHGVWTDVDLMQTMVLDPETAHEHFELMTIIAMRFIKDYVALGLDIIGIGGDFSGNRPIISPRSYRTFIVPELKKLSEVIHKEGKYVCNASDGNLWGVLEDFLINTGVDAYGEVDREAGMDLGKLKKAYGDKITFFGDMDSGHVLSFETPEVVAKQAIICLEEGWGAGGHIFTVSNAVTASVPLVNYLAMVNAYKDYFHLPRVTVSI